MSGKIQNRYNALVRELDISEYAPDYRLVDDVVPVVMLHEHCEGDCITNAATVAASSPTNIIASPVLRAGAYQVVLYMSWEKAVATAEACSFRIMSNATTLALDGNSLALLWYTDFGVSANDPKSRTLVIPKVHFPELSQLVCRLETSLIVNDYLTMGFVLQPI